jgi:hypothetical protein
MHSAQAEWLLVRLQPALAVFFESGIGLGLQLRYQVWVMLGLDMARSSGNGLGTEVASATLQGQIAFDRRQADAKKASGLALGLTRLDRSDNPFAQVLRIGSHTQSLALAQTLCKVL